MFICIYCTEAHTSYTAMLECEAECAEAEKAARKTRRVKAR